MTINFPLPEQCLLLENICHSFLILYCRRMPWECKYCMLQSILKVTVTLSMCKILFLAKHHIGRNSSLYMYSMFLDDMVSL